MIQSIGNLGKIILFKIEKYLEDWWAPFHAFAAFHILWAQDVSATDKIFSRKF